MNSHAIRHLACSVVLQAVRDYFSKGVTPAMRKVILKDLRSSWMDFFTNGTSVNVAEQLELHPEKIKERLRRNAKEGKL